MDTQYPVNIEALYPAILVSRLCLRMEPEYPVALVSSTSLSSRDLWKGGGLIACITNTRPLFQNGTEVSGLA